MQLRAKSVDSGALPDHVAGLIDHLPDDLTPEQRRTAVEFIKTHSSKFSKSDLT